MRHLPDVIDDMLKVIPTNHNLYTELKSVRNSSQVAAPEMQPFWWMEASTSLSDSIPKVKYEWHEDIIRIWKNEVAK